MGTTRVPHQDRAAVHISLDRHSLRRLDAQAQREGLSRSALVRRMVDEGLEDDEDLALAREARRRLDDPDEKRVPWERVKQELSL